MASPSSGLRRHHRSGGAVRMGAAASGSGVLGGAAEGAGPRAGASGAGGGASGLCPQMVTSHAAASVPLRLQPCPLEKVDAK